MTKKAFFSQLLSVVLMSLIILLNSCSQAALTGQDPVKNDDGVKTGSINKVVINMVSTYGLCYIFIPNMYPQEQNGWAWEACAKTLMNYMDPTCHVTELELYNLYQWDINVMNKPDDAKIQYALDEYNRFHGYAQCVRTWPVGQASVWGTLSFNGLPGNDIVSYINNNQPPVVLRRYTANNSLSYPLIVWGYNNNGRIPKVFTWDPRTNATKTWDWNSFQSDSSTYWDNTIIPFYDPNVNKYW
jgi:hypothetical protein